MLELPDHTCAAHLWPTCTAWWSLCRFMSLSSFCFDQTADHKFLGRLLKHLANTSCPCLIFTACGEVKVHANFSIVQSLALFIFVCRTCIQKYTKISTVPYSQKSWWGINLAVWQFTFATAKLKSTNISYLHIILYVWQSLTELPNLYPPILLQWTQPPNLIPANISGYTVWKFPTIQ